MRADIREYPVNMSDRGFIRMSDEYVWSMFASVESVEHLASSLVSREPRAIPNALLRYGDREISRVMRVKLVCSTESQSRAILGDSPSLRARIGCEIGQLVLGLALQWQFRALVCGGMDREYV
jgi:hypothetical protein